MGKFETLESAVYSIFSSVAWTAENIKVYPSNYVPSGSGKEFLIVHVIPSGAADRLNSVSGIIIIDIFTASGSGPKQASILSDKLDKYLLGKSIKSGKTTTFCSSSSLVHNGADKDNPALFRSIYTINFNFYGAT